MLNWKIKPLPEASKVALLQDDLPSLSSESICLLINRGITDFNTAKTFFTPDKNQICDPFLMKGMELAVDRLTQAISNGENILIYGDYDVDGTTSVSMMYLFLKEIGAEVSYYIPDRYKEGYGVSQAGISYAINTKVNLIISVDCGIRAVERIKEAKHAGIDFIICDHHEPPEILPPALAILDPKQQDCNYPYKELCGCGVAFKLLQGFCDQHTVDEELLLKYLDLLAIATCSDIVPITGENRLLVLMGLQKLNKNPLPGVKALINQAGYSTEFNVRSVVFGLGPRINAAGRISQATGAVELLTSKTVEEAVPLAGEIEKHNQERRILDKSITAEALATIKDSAVLQQKKSTVLANESWHKGVIGIVASRVIESYHKPTIIFTKADGLLTGSARSVGNFNILNAITACDHLLEKYGGHKFAAGLSLKEEHYNAFCALFEETVSNSISAEDQKANLNIDLEIPKERINYDFFHLLKRMEPFGPENMQPVFITKNLSTEKIPKLLKDQHLKFSINTGKHAIDCIGFGMKEYLSMVENNPFDLAYTIEENEYQGRRNLQLMIRGIRPSTFSP